MVFGCGRAHRSGGRWPAVRPAPGLGPWAACMLVVIRSAACRSSSAGPELHEFAAGVEDRDVPGWEVERVAGGG